MGTLEPIQPTYHGTRSRIDGEEQGVLALRFGVLSQELVDSPVRDTRLNDYVEVILVDCDYLIHVLSEVEHPRPSSLEVVNCHTLRPRRELGPSFGRVAEADAAGLALEAGSTREWNQGDTKLGCDLDDRDDVGRVARVQDRAGEAAWVERCGWQGEGGEWRREVGARARARAGVSGKGTAGRDIRERRRQLNR